MRYTNFILFLVILLFCFGCKFQTRAISRITGSALELELPDDFDKPISFASGRKSEKDLFYYSTNGELKVKTYTNYGILESEIIFVNK
tara:strand:+ start:960 stop:1223 length:264 start_codon:yes stop_codon:yes gene_type:complete